MAKSDTIRDTYFAGGNPGVGKTDKFIAGVECEIENLSSWGALDYNIWNDKEDGSLKHYGREFVSRPLEAETLMLGFQRLHGSLIFRNNDEDLAYSPRTSIHVHVNCLDLSQEQVTSIIKWYSLFEDFFFLMCHQSRRNNIHCVGLNQTILSEYYRRSLPVMLSNWHKYTALNILPLSALGTIEFRHMEGHKDSVKFKCWMNVLRNLWTFGQKNLMSKDIIQNNEKIIQGFDEIFSGSPMMAYRHQVMNIIENSLIDLKLSLN